MSGRQIIRAISPRTDREWPADHPLRSGARVLTDAQIRKIGGFLICSAVGEKRQPAAPDDSDVITTCAHCPTQIVHRMSAAKHLIPICIPCWNKLDAKEPIRERHD